LKDIVPAAFIAAVLFELVKAAFGFYLVNFANYALVFGPLSAIIAFLVWVYFSANVVLYGAEIAAAIPEARLPRMGPVGKPAPLWLQALHAVHDLLLKPGHPQAAADRRRESGETPPRV
jgi:membrane protein